MSIAQLQQLPSPESVRAEYPLTPQHRIGEQRKEIQDVITGADPRLLAIVGPCSAYPFDTVRKYADRLARLSEQISERILIVMRTYIQKPRTTVGWPGPLNQPDPLGPIDIPLGTRLCREMEVDVSKKLPIADEMLFMDNGGYFDDVLSYMALGARSAEDMPHRFVASGVEIPVGVKNPTSGDIETGVNGVQAVQASHEFAHGGYQVKTSGNPHAHLLLRGGKDHSNYGPRSIALAHKLLHDPKRGIRNPAIVVDASHDNARNGTGKDPLLQEHVLRDVLLGISQQREEYACVRGFMMESNIKAGSQKISPQMDPEISITDPCLGWEDTERILKDAAEQI